MAFPFRRGSRKGRLRQNRQGGGTGGADPVIAHPLAVATRPLGVRMMNFSRSMYGSISSAKVSVGMFMVAAMASTPVGPPMKTPHRVCKYRRSCLSRPCSSTSAISNAFFAASSVIRPSISLAEYWRAHHNLELAILGVPRLRLAISRAAVLSRTVSSFRALAETIVARSSSE